MTKYIVAAFIAIGMSGVSAQAAPLLFTAQASVAGGPVEKVCWGGGCGYGYGYRGGYGYGYSGYGYSGWSRCGYYVCGAWGSPRWNYCPTCGRSWGCGGCGYYNGGYRNGGGWGWGW